jgi:hypothetical protein
MERQTGGRRPNKMARKPKESVRPASSRILVILVVLATSAVAASSEWRDEDPSQWTGRDVFLILNNSPWSKKLKIKPSSGGLAGLTDQGANTGPGSNAPMPPSTGGMGRQGGMGGSRSHGTYSSGGSRNTSSTSNPGPTEVTVQWQSALVVRMAATKNAGETVDVGSYKPLDEYVIAIIGLPITVVGGGAASADSGNSSRQANQERVAANVKKSAAIVRSGHDQLTPTKVELDQGSDGRMLIYFSKSDPIGPGDKNIEFHLGSAKSGLKTKFSLKEMEYQGKLQL